jgi:hypothetical protein
LGPQPALIVETRFPQAIPLSAPVIELGNDAKSESIACFCTSALNRTGA